ncbi:MAG: endolytic transglycosylase MltG [Sporichthyaceae bacterium]
MAATRSDAPPPRTKRRRRSAVALVLAVVLLLVFAVGSTLGFGRVFDKLTEAKGDYAGPPGAERVVEIAPGTSLRGMGQQLQDAGVVKSKGAFVSAAGNNPKSNQIGPGQYRLAEKLPARDAIARLLDPKFRVLSRVAIPEGYTVAETLAKLAAETKIPLQQYRDVLAKPAEYGLPDFDKNPPEHRAEGFLFPATYEIRDDDTAAEVLTQFTTRFKRAQQATGLGTKTAPRNLTPFQVLTVASLIEAEAKLAVDMPKVARVIYNRLEQGMRLQFDSTVHFAVGGAKKITTTAAERDVDSPYNTYRNAGLPAGPICSPGEAAIAAALNPAEGNWLYFVSVNPDTGETRYGATLAEHNANVEVFRQWLRDNPGR